jgi:putative toxin-antitoxin system antitoxin component (TIGR02293 family)
MAEPIRATPGQIATTLGGRSVLKVRVRTQDDLIKAIRSGLSYGSLEAVKTRFDIKAEILNSLLHLPPRTLARRKSSKRFDSEESDRLVRIARIGTLAEETLGSRERAAGWLRSANRALGGAAPISRLDTDLGTREVEDLLLRIAHGVYS